MAKPDKDNSLESKAKNRIGWMLSVLILLLAASMAWAAEIQQTADPRPNILFVFTDDHAIRAVSAYGSKINSTPNMDRLAREGMIFRNSFVTNSICAPSRAVILTGKYSHLNGIIDNRSVFDGSQQTMPKLLQQKGYQTAVIGKWHLRSDPTGFDHWEVLDGANEQGFYYNPAFRTPRGLVEHTGYTTRIITDRALKWLSEGRDPERPFLLMYQHKAPHRNWAPGPDQLAMYDDRQLPEPDTLFDDYSDRTMAAHFQEMTIAHHMNETDLKLRPPFNLTPEQLRLWNAAYGPKNRAFEEAASAVASWCAGSISATSRTTFAQWPPSTTSWVESWIIWTKPAWPKTQSSSITRTRVSTWASTAGSTSASCTKNHSGLP